jgi:hypothetical protein
MNSAKSVSLFWPRPGEFSEPINAEDCSIGSSPKLRDEMQLLKRAARGVDAQNLREMLDAAIDFFLAASTASVEHRLPFIFDG